MRDQRKQRLFDNRFHSGYEKLIPVDVLCSEFQVLKKDIKKFRI
jgi:hypothetical protein